MFQAAALRREGPERRDDRPRRRPWRGGTGAAGVPLLNVTPAVLWLIIANLAVHLVRMLLPDALDAHLFHILGLVAARLTGALPRGPADPLTLISYQFLHAGLDHLGINMLALLAFGVGVERRIGAWRFLVFYLICGVAGGAAHLIAFASSPVPLVGASGAISGCFAAALRLVTGARDPAAPGGLAGLRQVAVIAAIWLGSQVLFGAIGDGAGLFGLVAWWAHVGGFLAGLLLIRLFLPRPPA